MQVVRFVNNFTFALFFKEIWFNQTQFFMT